ncbi:uncharacterized protein LOC121299853 isoform X1 [Polyodon spathula]|uniref:uncharacterized protein LOC121299853 isoform X1 n=1 Tax=Polyodon spathula TaxID=7913 RepID=UPI001B7F3734|nr:uncharacterized protein LOC121299853 isoform X1 [Polyodon spathula]XP_041083942.1 uncharacterized protein LOC121299853 isoform X1 [Polyodon spathula]
MEKTLPSTANWAPIFMTAALLWASGAHAHKVYYSCGAVVDVVDSDEQGLVLSPGFPNSYYPGLHCVWQFFVPAGYRLVMDVFDFDVFETSSEDGSSPGFRESLADPTDESSTPDPDYEAAPERLSNQTAGSPSNNAEGNYGGYPRTTSKKDDPKQVLVQEQSSRTEAAKVSNWARQSSEFLPSDESQAKENSSPGVSGDNRISTHSYRGDDDDYDRPGESTTPSLKESTDDVASSATRTQPPPIDACPHDLLYISDLMTFSSRFCGANKPSGQKLVFGNSVELVEVIVELITTTGRGRGFALLFQYRNETDTGSDRSLEPGNCRADALLAVVSAAAFFTVVLAAALCVLFRQKICGKGANSYSPNNQESQRGIQNSAVGISELQLVVPNRSSLEISTDNENNNHTQSPARTGTSLSDVCQRDEQEVSSSGLTESESGTDEVFVISAGPGPSGLSFSTYKQYKNLNSGETSPGTVCDWLTPDTASTPPFPDPRAERDSGALRPRAWSVRTFHDFLPPQLQRKWCSWNSTSPFTKLVDNGSARSGSDCGGGRERIVLSEARLEAETKKNHSDSSMSNASYPLSQHSQRQRRLNSTSNLQRARFGSPCFGFRTSLPESTKGPTGPPEQPSIVPVEVPNGSSSRTLQVDGVAKTRVLLGEPDGVMVPVFVISEEDDRQPLVLAEHLGQCGESHQNGDEQDLNPKRKKDHNSPAAQCHLSSVNGSPFKPSTTSD